MLVGEFLERIQNGETVTAIGEQLGLHRKTLQRRLKKLGYVWDQELLKWRWNGNKRKEPLHVSLTNMQRSWQPHPGIFGDAPYVNLDDIDSREVNSYEANDYSEEGGESSSFRVNSLLFTLDEVEGLKEMLNQWREAAALTVSTQEVDLVDRINGIKASPKDKVRKTIVINQDIAKKLDDFAEQKRLNKSDILHLAILDLIEKYQ